ncbi:hypothetical protein [Collinsella aerofaciens]|uniref:hypothetical protein n=1 Tax=Collinsella aerofaciens TaxID=74426 RepID=UPI003562C8A5
MLPSCLKSLVRDLGKTGARGVSKKLNAAHQVETAFGHDEYSCAFLATGECSIYSLSRRELMGLKDVPPDNKENEANYCRYLAERMLSGKAEDAWALRHNPCDGRHRDCIAAALRLKDIDVEIDVNWEY